MGHAIKVICFEIKMYMYIYRARFNFLATGPVDNYCRMINLSG